MVRAARGHDCAVLQARAGGGGRQARARALAHGRALRAALAVRHRHLRPHGAPARRAHGLVRYYEPENGDNVTESYRAEERIKTAVL